MSLIELIRLEIYDKPINDLLPQAIMGIMLRMKMC